MTQLTVGRKIVKRKTVCGGVPLIEGTRIRVSDIAAAYDFRGLRPEAIAREFSLSLADVFAALTYYYGHREEIRKELQERHAFFKHHK
jgi:uncharacterized protein (DUF433 family)